ERPDDGGNVGDEAAAAELVGDGEVAEGAAAGADAPGDGAAVADDVEAHLPAGAFGFEIRLPLGELLGELDRLAPGAFGGAVALDRLPHQIDPLHDFEHADIEPVPAVAEDRFLRHGRIVVV